MNRRALTALALYLGFYLISVALVAGLLSVPILQVRYGEGDLAGFLAFVGASYVAWAMFPRREKWVAPGPELTRDAQPRLWSVLQSVAADSGHPPPKHVYLVNSVQAFATARPRWFGLRRDPVVGLGLPIFAFLSEREIRAVVAHEMGHHVGGDVKLGAWQYRTSRAIGGALHRLDDSSVYLNLPFYAYGQLYLRLTRPASREQETHADALAARLAGARFLGSALLGVEQHALLWSPFFYSIVVPTVNEGFLPPLLEGYERYVRAVDREEHRVAFRKSVDAPSDPDDTHPPLRERLRALGTPCEPAEPRAAADTPLLCQRSECERLLIAAEFANPGQVDELKPLTWDEWGETIPPRWWARAIEPRMATFRTIALADIPRAAQDENLWERLRQGLNVFSDEAKAKQRKLLVGYWFAHLIHTSGYKVVSGPGEEITLQRESSRIMPFRFLHDLETGARSAADWDVLRLEIGL